MGRAGSLGRRVSGAGGGGGGAGVGRINGGSALSDDGLLLAVDEAGAGRAGGAGAAGAFATDRGCNVFGFSSAFLVTAGAGAFAGGVTTVSGGGATGAAGAAAGAEAAC